MPGSCQGILPKDLACPHFLSSSDLYEHKFIDCTFENSTFLKQKKGCHLDFERDNDFLIYLVSFLGSLSVLPGNIVSALLMDKVGRIKMIGEWIGMTSGIATGGSVVSTEGTTKRCVSTIGIIEIQCMVCWRG